MTQAGARTLLEDAYPVYHTADGWLEEKVRSRENQGVHQHSQAV